MKNLTLVLAVILFNVGLSAQAQDYQPTSTWPYLYEDFVDGVIYLKDGTKLNMPLNVQLRSDKIHFLDKDVVKQAVVKDVVAVFIGEDKFILVDGKAMKVVKEAQGGCVVKESLGDFASLNETGGAYGTSSSTSATRKVSSLELDSQVNQQHMLLLEQKHEGQPLPLMDSFYLVTPKLTVKALKSDVEAVLTDGQKNVWKSWLKENKIKWKDPESLSKLVDFLINVE